MASDGCGGVLDCGMCADGLFCGGAGPNICGNQACTPKTCAEQMADCGSASDGCSTLLDCGGCTAPQVCGANGMPNRCSEPTCVPTTCAAAGAQCGIISNGCGDTLDCGGCTGNLTCGGGGTANRCGDGPCTPKSCGEFGAQCGMIGDGCGGTIACGGCTAPLTCGGGGTANQCGTMCSPMSCSDLGAQCGAIDDGCGTNLDCGECNAPLTCGGAGTANQCGASCNQTCPSGYTCSSGGECVGGVASMLMLSISVPQTITVSGRVRQNGGPVQLDPNRTEGCVRLRFTHEDGIASLSEWACSSNDYAFSYELYAGAYRITAEDNGSTRIPDNAVEVAAAQTFNGSTSYDVDVSVPPTITVSGRLLQNGGAIELDPNRTEGCFRMRFTHEDGLVSRSEWVCSSNNYAYSYELYAGTYRITAEDNGSTRVPDNAVEVVGRIRLQ